MQDSYGSFFVFRKLEQDVAGFHKRLAGIDPERWGPTPSWPGPTSWAGSKTGAPVELHDHELGAETQDYVTNFNYADDMRAGAVARPTRSIRKTNPRGDTVCSLSRATSSSSGTTASCCRGVPFGKQPPRGNDSYLAGRPPLALAYQSDIGNQFEDSCERRGRSASNSCASMTGLDPIIGQRRVN